MGTLQEDVNSAIKDVKDVLARQQTIAHNVIQDMSWTKLLTIALNAKK